MSERVRRIAFAFLKSEFTAKSKQRLIKDIEGTIEESESLQALLDKGVGAKLSFVAVTCDRRKNDSKFSYPAFDFLLVSLDRLSGGNGTYKPLHQVRAIRWNGTRRDLMAVLLHFAKLHPSMNFRRALLLPFPVPSTGFRISQKIYLK